jgi:hypothetical protein
MRRSSPTPLDHFIASLHRRLLVLRMLEGAGLGALAGCAVGGIVIPLLLWRGVPTLPPTLAAIVVGAASGLLWSVARRPTRLRAAVEADRQLVLSDLLATALAVAPRPRESDRDAEAAPWLRTVLAAADDACRRHAPSQVILRRLGGRAWGGIALAAALVLTLSALTTQEPAARAASGAGAARGRPTEGAIAGVATEPSRGPTPGRPAPSRSPGAGPRSEGGSTANASSDAQTPQAAGVSGAGRDAGSTGDAGSGGGAGRARNTFARESAPPPASASASRPGGTVPSAGGAGRAATRPASGGGTPGGTVTPDESITPKAAPWHSTGWADDARRARDLVDSGQVPGSRRDLVRDYFERP